ncbi:MAG TPA: hypothetical protein VGN95_14180 [Pyrinomonadaceae bacterium]|jgi:hypothetical protein|nr:hypothetical protein [Pyrinomonadaceae bacterium]
MQFAQICDRVEIDAAPVGPVDISALLGTWVNSNPETTGIARLLITEADGKPALEVQAIGPDGLINWGTIDVTVFAASPSSRVGTGFTCLYDFGFAETRLQGMILKGLTVLSQFHSFKDDSRRVDYFLREYFALEHGRY